MTTRQKSFLLSDSRNPGHGLMGLCGRVSDQFILFYEFDGFIKDEADLADYKTKMKGGVPTNLRVGDAKYVDKRRRWCFGTDII